MPTPQEFAAAIKAKHPYYKDVDDMVLAKKMIEKYPQYADRVKFDSGITKIESLLRGGVQGATFDFGEEIGGGIRGLAQSGFDAAYGNKQGSLAENFRTNRDEIRGNNQAAREANPKTYTIGEIGGSALPAMLTGGSSEGVTAASLGQKVVSGAKTGAALGGIYGLGSSEADLTKGQFGRAAVDTGIGAGFGATVGSALPVATKGISEAYGAAKKGAGKLGKKLVSSVFGPSEESIDALLKNPSKIEHAKTYADLAEDMPKTLDTLDKMIKKDDNKAWELLKTSHNPEEGAIPKEKISKLINSVKNDARITGGGTFGQASKKAVGALDSLMEDLESVGKNVKGKVKSEMGVDSALKNKDFISEAQLKELIQAADDNTLWNVVDAGPMNESLQNLRESLDGLLKGNNKEYEKAMEPVSEKVNLKNKFIRAFNIKRETGKGYVPTDTTAGKIEMAPKEKRIHTQDILNTLKSVTGEDYLDQSKTAGLAKQFQGGKVNGSRSVNQMATVGGSLGAGAGAMVGGPIGAAVGGGAGTMAGALTGGYIDKHGGEMAAKLVLKFAKSQPQKLGKYAPVFQKALEASGGSADAAIIPHLVLIDADPQYKKMVDGLVRDAEKTQRIPLRVIK